MKDVKKVVTTIPDENGHFDTFTVEVLNGEAGPGQGILVRITESFVLWCDE